MSAKKLSREQAQEALDAYSATGSVTLAARKLGLPKATFENRHGRAVTMGLVPSKQREGESNWTLPATKIRKREELVLTGIKRALVINDVHIPYHAPRELELALDYGVKTGCETLLINGDLIDLCSVSDHEKTPDERNRLAQDLEDTELFLHTVTKAFSRTIWNEGNHEYRLPRYFLRHAPELFNLYYGDGENAWLPKACHFTNKGTWVPQDRPLRIGQLHIRHGHEFKRGGGVMIARTIGLAAGENIIFGNFHRTQEFIEPRISGKIAGSWAVGMLCDPHPTYLPENKWNFGFAVVDFDEDGGFEVQNRKIINARIY